MNRSLMVISDRIRFPFSSLTWNVFVIATAFLGLFVFISN